MNIMEPQNLNCQFQLCEMEKYTNEMNIWTNLVITEQLLVWSDMSVSNQKLFHPDMVIKSPCKC